MSNTMKMKPVTRAALLRQLRALELQLVNVHLRLEGGTATERQLQEARLKNLRLIGRIKQHPGPIA